MADASGYKNRAYQQSLAWVRGESIHEPINDECTPDFSCCDVALFEKDRLKRIQDHNLWCRLNGFPPYTD